MIVVSKSATEKILLASFSSFSPNLMPIFTDAPTAIMSPTANTIIIIGNTRFIAAKALLPIIFPTNIPSAII